MTIIQLSTQSNNFSERGHASAHGRAAPEIRARGHSEADRKGSQKEWWHSMVINSTTVLVLNNHNGIQYFFVYTKKHGDTKWQHILWNYIWNYNL